MPVENGGANKLVVSDELSEKNHEGAAVHAIDRRGGLKNEKGSASDPDTAAAKKATVKSGWASRIRVFPKPRIAEARDEQFILKDPFDPDIFNRRYHAQPPEQVAQPTKKNLSRSGR